MIESHRLDRWALSDEQLRWIEQLADAQTPPVGTSTMLGRLIDEAMVRHGERERRRAERFEVYEASGYSEHHPDYPDFP